MRSTAVVVPVAAGKERELPRLVEALHPDAVANGRDIPGAIREAIFLQRTPVGAQVIVYREWERGPGDPPDLMRALAALTGLDGTGDVSPPVEQLLHELPPAAGGELHAFAAPLRPGKTGRMREFASELSGIHAQEFTESLRRLGVGVTLFLQRTPHGDLVVTVLEGPAPDDALARMAMSEHPFDRWHVQQIADLHGMDLRQMPPPVIERLR
jgi:hypothetical protein